MRTKVPAIEPTVLQTHALAKPLRVQEQRHVEMTIKRFAHNVQEGLLLRKEHGQNVLPLYEKQRQEEQNQRLLQPLEEVLAVRTRLLLEAHIHEVLPLDHEEDVREEEAVIKGEKTNFKAKKATYRTNKFLSSFL